MKSFDPLWLSTLTLLGILMGAGFAALAKRSQLELAEPEPDLESAPSPSTQSLALPLSDSLNLDSTPDSTSMDYPATSDSSEQANLVKNQNNPAPETRLEDSAKSELNPLTALDELSPTANLYNHETAQQLLTKDEPVNSAVNPNSASIEAKVKAEVESEPDATETVTVPEADIQPKRPLPVTPAMPLQANFDIKSFQRTLIEALQIQGKTLQTATAEDFYTLLIEMVRQRLLQANPERQLIQPLVQPQTPITVEIAAEFGPEPSLQTDLINLGLLEPVTEALQQLGITLPQLFELASEPESTLGYITSSLLDALTTANKTAIGYGMYSTANRLQTVSRPMSSLDQTTRPELANTLEVKFGGHVKGYVDTQERYCRDWAATEVVQVAAYDIPISGYGTERVNLLRLWREVEPFASAKIDEENRLRQSFLLASAAVQDTIRLHLASGQPIEMLHQRFILHLHDAALVIAELMHQFVDHHYLGWDQAWSITQNAVSSTFYGSLSLSNRWRIDLVNQLLPRHLEIIHEINRRFLEEVRCRYSNPEPRVERMSFVEQSGYLRVDYLACVGSNRVTGITPLHTQLIQNSVFADFDDLYSQLYANKFDHRRAGITPRRFLLQANPRLANLLTASIGNGWMTHPEQLQQLEALIEDPKFCGNWWQTKRNNKQAFAAYIQQHTGITVNLDSIFDVQAAPIEPDQRQLLPLLHVITLYRRLKINATTDTIQRFAHRSMPRTCVFVGAASSQSPAVAALIRAVAAAINNDLDVQGRLQVIFLEDYRFKTLALAYAAADVAEQIPLADAQPPSIVPFKFALNGAITIGTPNSINLEIRQAAGAKNLFLFGMTASEVTSLLAKGYDPYQCYSTNSELQQVINLIASGYFTYSDSNSFRALAEELVHQDPALILAEYASYMSCQERISQSFQDQKAWTWMSILTTARMGRHCVDCGI